MSSVQLTHIPLFPLRYLFTRALGTLTHVSAWFLGGLIPGRKSRAEQQTPSRPPHPAACLQPGPRGPHSSTGLDTQHGVLELPTCLASTPPPAFPKAWLPPTNAPLPPNAPLAASHIPGRALVPLLTPSFPCRAQPSQSAPLGTCILKTGCPSPPQWLWPLEAERGKACTTSTHTWRSILASPAQAAGGVERGRWFFNLLASGRQGAGAQKTEVGHRHPFQ